MSASCPLPVHSSRARGVLIGIAAAAAALAYFVSGLDPSTSRPPPDRSVVLSRSVVTVAPGVHLLGETSPNASYVVETSEGLVLVDTCPDADAGPVIRQVHSLGLDVARLRIILLTHAHADHALGARTLRVLTGAKVHAGKADCDVLRAGGPHEALFSIFCLRRRAHPTDVDVELVGDEVIELGDTRIRAIASPGHTPGSTCYLLERDGLRILFTGDVVMSLTDSEPLTGPGIYSAYLPPRYRGNARDSRESLLRLRGMAPPDVVLPGHPASDRRPQSPWMTAQRWRSLLDDAIAKLDLLLERFERDGADFLDGTPKELLPGLHYWGDCDGAALYGLVAPDGRLFLFDAPGGPEVLAERLRGAGLSPRPPTAVLLTSCEPQAIAGLASLVERTGCTVVAPAGAIARVERICPPGTTLLPAERLPSAGWFPVVVLPVQGLESAATAYVLRWEGRTVLLSGHEPWKNTLEDGFAVKSATAWRGTDRDRYFQSLQALDTFAPGLWLPAVPTLGQNANLYDADWARVLTSNRALVE